MERTIAEKVLRRNSLERRRKVNAGGFRGKNFSPDFNQSCLSHAGCAGGLCTGGR
ncbi:MAG: hypothetical protein ACE5HC_14260 [Candidatus Binatia bacterium]